MLKVALTGADGLVGSRVVELLKDDFEFIPLPQSRMDITDQASVRDTFKSMEFDVFLHLAAYTNVAKAETDRDIAFKVNRDGTGNVFRETESRGRKFIFISTDFVFDGTNPPYGEKSHPNPLAVYAASKYEGEKIVNEKAMIVRISYPYRASFAAKKDFFRTFKTFLEEKKPLKMITNSLMTPTFIDDIAFGLRHLINNYSPEVFHLVGSQAISPYNAAILIAEKFGLGKYLVGKTSYAEYTRNKAPLPRLANMVSKKNDFYRMKSFEEGLDEIKKQLI